MNSEDAWADEKARKWRYIAERVLTCRNCAHIRNKGRSLFHPEPGWGNLYAPVFVIGINGNWGERGRKELQNLEELRVSLKKNKERQFEPLTRYWMEHEDWSGPDPERFFKIYSPCTELPELCSRLESYYKLPGDRPQYDRILFIVLRGVILGSCNDPWSDENRNLLWRWVYWSNAVRCPSGGASKIPPQEFSSCFWTTTAERAPGNVLREELLLVGPSLVIVLGEPTIRDSAHSGQRIESHLGELLGMKPIEPKKVRVPHARKSREWTFSRCEYVKSEGREDSSPRVCALFLPHPRTPLAGRFWDQACQEAWEVWKSAKGASPMKLCSVGVPPSYEAV